MRTLDLSSSGQGLAGMGVPAPERMAYVVTLVELVGGALLIIRALIAVCRPPAHY